MRRERFSDQDSKENYQYAMRVVDITNPDKSLLVIKPTRPTDSAGNVGDYLATHNGGQRWHGNESSEQYRTIWSGSGEADSRALLLPIRMWSGGSSKDLAPAFDSRIV